MNQTNIKRIEAELIDIAQDKQCIYFFHINDVEDLFHWQAIFRGSDESPYAGGNFIVDIEIPLDYPFSPPKITFLTKIYHPNIDSAGNISLDILKDQWSVVLSISSVLLAISFLMNEPNAEKAALEPKIAKQCRKRKEKFWEIAKEWTIKYAM